MAGTNPRAAKIAALIQRVIASNMESHLHDKRLSSVTITEVRVTNDLQIAKVYWTQLGHEGKEQGERQRAAQALQQAHGRLRSLVGAKAGLRLTPQLQFIYDEVPTEAHEIEDILVAARKRDEELAKARENAQYAGDVDPYKKPREVDSLESSEDDEYSEDEYSVDESLEDKDSEEDESLEDDATSEDESEDESL
ncbi:30S ribosome-binding factor RbfA [Gardnerella vaginalis]|uniref:Ribosome-binding factor A n=1 Tax=Gardnerella vaginalis TaxID=2702 RepID=A0A2K1SWP9_GARVA|nr:30S ribosome-binding factor RbfA [Gardnerella vaginalis]PNS43948.1 30S ribosome-binding factor RbfA [Gardnerella vaginalis]